MAHAAAAPAPRGGAAGPLELHPMSHETKVGVATGREVGPSHAQTPSSVSNKPLGSASSMMFG